MAVAIDGDNNVDGVDDPRDVAEDCEQQADAELQLKHHTARSASDDGEGGGGGRGEKIRSGRTEGGAYAAATVAEEDAERGEDEGDEDLEEEAASLRSHPCSLWFGSL